MNFEELKREIKPYVLLWTKGLGGSSPSGGSGGGGGDFYGPGVSVAGNILSFDGVDGKHGVDSGYSAASFALAGHNHAGVYEPAGAVAAHAIVTTGVHGLAIAAGQVLTVPTGGTLGTAAYSDASAYESAGSVGTHAAVKTGVHGLINAGDYNLTIPATGTVALLGLENVFTENQKLQKPNPIHDIVNTSTTQYTVSAFRLYNSAPSFGNNAGVYFNNIITDAAATQSAFTMLKVDYQGNYVSTLQTIDINNARFGWGRDPQSNFQVYGLVADCALGQHSGIFEISSNWGVDIGFGEDTDSLMWLQAQITGSSAAYPIKIQPLGGGVIFNDSGAASGDFRAESDTEPNMLFLDASADTIEFGGTGASGTKISKGGVINAASDIIIGASGIVKTANYASQTTGWGISYAGGGDFRTLYADEMHAKSFIADLEQALAGGQIISKSVAVLAADFTAPAAGASASLVVEEFRGFTAHVYQDGDIVRVRNQSRSGYSLAVDDCWGTAVYASRDGTAKTQTYTFTRSSAPNAGSMTAATVVPAGGLALDYGVSGNGYVETTAIDGAMAASAPYNQVVSWSTHPATGQTVRTRTGNLNGLFGVADEYGFYAGDGVADANHYLRVTNTVTEIHNLAVKMSAAGTESFIAIGTTPPTSASVGTGIWLDRTGMYGLAANVLEAKFDAVTGTITAGGGGVTLDHNGITLASTTDGNLIGAYKFDDINNSITGKHTVGGDKSMIIGVNALTHSSEILINASNDQSALYHAYLDLASDRTSSYALLRAANIGFFNVAAIAQPGATTDLGTVLSSLGLRVAGTAYPINTSGAVQFTGGVTITTAGITLTDQNIVLGTITGTCIGTATNQKLSFYNATPIVQPYAYTQTYTNASKIHLARTAAALTNNVTGSGTTIADPETSYTRTTLRNNFWALADQINKNRNDALSTAQVLNSLIDDLQALGLVG